MVLVKLFANSVNCLYSSLFVLTLFPNTGLFSFFEYFYGSEFVFANFGVLGLFKPLSRIQLLKILLGFRV